MKKTSSSLTPAPMPDMQKRLDTRRIPIAKVGVKDITYPIVVMDKNRTLQHTVARINMYVDLPHHFKGTHMSRFVEILNKYREQIALDKLETILDEMKAKLGVEEVTLDFVKEKLSTMTRKEAFEWLVSFDVPSAPIYEAYEGFDDPHLKARKTFVEVPHPVAGSYRIPKFPAEFSETPAEIKTGAIILGQHTEEILSKVLKKTKKQIEELEQNGVVTIWRP